MKPLEGILFFALMMVLGVATHFMPFYVMAGASLIVAVVTAVHEDKGGRDDYE